MYGKKEKFVFFAIAPYGFDQVTVLSNTAYSIVITWDPPSSPNGIISNYTVIIDSNLFKTLHVAISMYNVSGLLPYSTYNVSVAACNNAGCTETPVIAVTTDEAGTVCMSSLYNYTF